MNKVTITIKGPTGSGKPDIADTIAAALTAYKIKLISAHDSDGDFEIVEVTK